MRFVDGRCGGAQWQGVGAQVGDVGKANALASDTAVAIGAIESVTGCWTD